MEIKKENMEWLAEAMHYVKSKVNENLPKYSTVFPTSSSENLIYGEMGNKDWTEGFCGFCMKTQTKKSIFLHWRHCSAHFKRD